ncbi:hypothetical protein SDJN03_21626, partial [Cucurbita argyrosperma subsp. sororia]
MRMAISTKIGNGYRFMAFCKLLHLLSIFHVSYFSSCFWPLITFRKFLNFRAKRNPSIYFQGHNIYTVER